MQGKVKSYRGAVRIGELAARSSLTVKTIRFYEQVGVLPEPARRESGYRDYDETAAARLQFVKAAQTAGLTLAQIREVIAVRDQSGPPCRHVVELLDAHADSLDRRIADLTALRDDVRRLQDRAATLDPASCRSATVCQVIPVAGQPVGQAASPARPPDLLPPRRIRHRRQSLTVFGRLRSVVRVLMGSCTPAPM